LPSPKFSIIFPTPDEIRQSLNGYRSGGSIHMKLQSAPQQKQLEYLRPYLCRWAGDANGLTGNTQSSSAPERMERTKERSNKRRIREAGRCRAAPHIKTYIRFSDADMTKIDWAMITSANLSTQAWGAGVNAKQEVRICSWEIGVLIWPDLYASKAEDIDETDEHITNKIEMVPSFKRDVPENSEHLPDARPPSTLIGFRMPYDLPLIPYTHRDNPWCATSVYREPDCLGQTWEDQ
jgi:tyrosyl-DNA phosphodiesterase-1